MTKKASHQANIVRITEIKEHTNADTLVIIPIGEYQVVSKKGQFNIGDLGVYIQPDSVVPQTEPFRFIWNEYAICPECHCSETHKMSCDARKFGEVPENRRRITVRKFRKEWSEGLLLPITDFNWPVDRLYNGEQFVGQAAWINGTYAKEGDDVSDLLGIIHYDPDAGKEDGAENYAPKAKKRYPRSIRGWVKFLFRKVKNFLHIGAVIDGASDNVSLGIPTYDVDSYKVRPADFIEGEQVRISEKIHGSNARYIFLDGVMYAGSRNLWKSANSTCIYRRALKEFPWISSWCEAHPGYVLWGEVTPTQKGYEYGSKEVQFFVFDVYTSDGKWLDESTSEGLEILTQLQPFMVPVLYKGPYKGYDHVKQFVDGQSTVPGAKNIREGVVVATTRRDGNRSQRKVVSNVFLEKDNK